MALDIKVYKIHSIDRLHLQNWWSQFRWKRRSVVAMKSHSGETFIMMRSQPLIEMLNFKTALSIFCGTLTSAVCNNFSFNRMGFVAWKLCNFGQEMHEVARCLMHVGMRKRGGQLRDSRVKSTFESAFDSTPRDTRNQNSRRPDLTPA